MQRELRCDRGTLPGGARREVFRVQGEGVFWAEWGGMSGRGQGPGEGQ